MTPVGEVPKPEIFQPKTKESYRPKTTINLGNILKPTTQAVELKEETRGSQSVDRPIDLDELKQVWDAYAELRKDQLAEHHLLKRGFDMNGSELIISISNPVEEPLLVSMKTNLVTYLRERLGNSSIQVRGILKEVIGSKRIAYTNKEKFESLASKNSLLNELKDRFGLDPDF